MKWDENLAGTGIPEGIKLEEIQCPLAPEAKDDTVMITRDYTHGNPGNWRLVRNRKSGMVRTTPRPTLDTMGAFYSQEYPPFHKPERKQQRSKWKEALLSRFDPYWMPEYKPGNMFEIGCATGTFMARMQEKGWKVEGLEPDAFAAEAARSQGFTVHNEQLETVADPKEKYDLIVGWMVLEHLHQPLETLKKMHGWAKPGSKLVVAVPNFASLDARIFGRYWYALHLPCHLFHYTPGTLSRLMQSAGWRVEKVHHQYTLANWFGSLGVWLSETGRSKKLGGWLRALPSRSNRLFSTLMIPVALLFGWLGITGRMTVIATRNDA